MESERLVLAQARIKEIQEAALLDAPFNAYFEREAAFLAQVCDIYHQLQTGAYQQLSRERLQQDNAALYADIRPGHYGESYGNPAFTTRVIGPEFGPGLLVLYAELRGAIAYAFEGRSEELTILFELFLEVYTLFAQREATPAALREIIYWYASDYCDVFVARRVAEQLDPDRDFFCRTLQSCGTAARNIFLYGEYISDSELQMAEFISRLSAAEVEQIAAAFTEGYRRGFITTRKDITRKQTVNIRYTAGCERIIAAAIEQFRAIGLRPVIYRAAASVLTKRSNLRIGFTGGVANPQYDYDHRNDQGYFQDKKYLERKLEVMAAAYEAHRALARAHGGPAVLETFGEPPFAPTASEGRITLTSKQQAQQREYDSRAGQLTNTYIPGEERSYTIMAFPVPAIGPDFEAIFAATVRVNTLDNALYTRLQQTLITALDQGEYVRIKGRGANRTDFKVRLAPLADPARETKFENCVADVNIPVGEVFTSPVLEGTNGTLQVTQVYLNGQLYRDLELTFTDGWVTAYDCRNFADAAENQAYLADSLLHGHQALPLGEFAIGTNTTAYALAETFGIQDKLPILIAEKTGPHFAIGDTCYSWSEDVKVYNPDGKEIIARDNSASRQRLSDPQKAYFNCHTDITIPYDEIGRIEVVTAAGETIPLLADGEFVLPGTEVLNEPLKSIPR